MSESSVILIVGGVLAVLLFRLQGTVEAVHRATNSMKDALVAATRAAAFSEGMEKQRAVQAQLELQRHVDEQAKKL